MHVHSSFDLFLLTHSLSHTNKLERIERLDIETIFRPSNNDLGWLNLLLQIFDMNSRKILIFKHLQEFLINKNGSDWGSNYKLSVQAIRTVDTSDAEIEVEVFLSLFPHNSCNSSNEETVSCPWTCRG